MPGDVEIPEEARKAFKQAMQTHGMGLVALQAAAPSLRAQGAEEAKEERQKLAAHLSDASVALKDEVVDGKELAFDVSLAEAIRLILAQRDQALQQGAEEERERLLSNDSLHRAERVLADDGAGDAYGEARTFSALAKAVVLAAIDQEDSSER